MKLTTNDIANSVNVALDSDEFRDDLGEKADWGGVNVGGNYFYIHANGQTFKVTVEET